MRVLSAVLGIVLATAGVAAQQKDDAAIARIRAAYQAAAGAQDGAALAKLYAPDGVELAPNAPAAKGRAAIEAFHKAFAQQWMVHGLTITASETKVAGDVAYEVGTYKQSLMSPKGGGMVDDKGKYIVLMKKDASGNWWITHSMYNSDNPLPAAAAKK
jgi:uncharacterized protein (TIGR02246 family)